MKLAMLTWMLTLTPIMTGCQSLIQLGASPIPVTTYSSDN